MYFIFSILTFLTLSLTSFGVSTQIKHEDWECFFIGVSTVTGLTSVILLLVMMFQNMYFVTQIRRYSNAIRRSIRSIQELNNDLGRYKEEFTNILTEMYPKYEKDIFKNMATSDARNLEMILVKYPELKFDGILTTYVDGIKRKLEDITDYKRNITGCIRDISNINDSGWKLFRTKLATDIQSI